MRIAESFCKMRLSEYCSAQDIDRAIAVTVESFIGSQKVSCKKALSRTFAKYVIICLLLHFGDHIFLTRCLLGTHFLGPSRNPSAVRASQCRTRIYLVPRPRVTKHPSYGLVGGSLGFFEVKYHLCLHLVCTALSSSISFYLLRWPCWSGHDLTNEHENIIKYQYRDSRNLDSLSLSRGEYCLLWCQLYREVPYKPFFLSSLLGKRFRIPMD